ncbi:MAG: hypothetical protein R8J85_09730, partial [Mariprofundales bacterium]
AQLAPILDGVLPDGLKRYPDQPQTSDSKAAAGVVGVRSEKVAVIPLHGGSFILPGVDIAWWNTATGKIEVASVAPRTIRVEAAASAPSPTARHHPSASSALPSSQADHGVMVGWQWAAMVLLLLWLATLALWWRARRSVGKKVQAEVAQGDGQAALRQQITAACRSHDDAQLIHLLSQWTLDLQRQGVVVQQFPCLAQTIAALHRHRYGGGEGVDFGVLQQQFAQACAELDAPPASSSAIPPLY